LSSEFSRGFFRLIPERVATVCARFGKCPSDYEKTHGWSDLQYDYSIARQLNMIDQEKERLIQEQMNGGKSGR